MPLVPMTELEIVLLVGLIELRLKERPSKQFESIKRLLEVCLEEKKERE